MYKIRLQNREIDDRVRIDDFITECQVVRVGMVSHGEPYIVPVNFVYTQGTVYFHCAMTGRKHQCFQTGDRVCLEFDEMHGISVDEADTWYTSVIGWGKSQIIQERELCRSILEMLVEKYLGTPREITDNMVERTCIVGIRIEEVTGKENLSGC